MIIVTLVLYVFGVLVKLGCSFEFELRNMSRVPIVIVFGATGTGKSKLAIKLAQKFNGEIISADSMQVYKGLDIASNKVTQAERAEARHHMLDVLKPTERYTVTDYRNKALPIIDDILKRKKLPIVVGGTNYYIESILWNMLVEPVDNKSDLVYNRFEVLKDPNHINQWQTYKGSVLPLREGRDYLAPLRNVGCDEKTDKRKTSVADEDVNSIIERIKSVNGEFKRTLKSIQDTMNIAYKFYKRTLYGFHSSSDAAAIQERDSNSTAEADQSYIVDIVKLEDTLLNEYIGRNLEHVTDFLANRSGNVDSIVTLNDTDPVEELNLKDSYAVLAGNASSGQFGDFSFLSGLQFWNIEFVGAIASKINDSSSVAVLDDRYEEHAIRIREVCESRQQLSRSCYAIFKKLLDCVIAMTTVRIKRLNLIRVIDDYSMLDFENDDLVAELKIVDPDILETVHPNNRRKIIRALQAYFLSGETLSEFQEKQRQMTGASSVFGPLRFPDACLLWLHCDQEVLDGRLTVRVNEMMEMGLIEELLEFHKQYNVQRLAHNLKADYTKGIFQSIGLKEFHPYLMLNEELRASDIGRKLLDAGIAALKVATTQYSKYQTRYMHNRFIKVPETKKVPPIFRLNTTDLDKWNEEVESKAFSIVESYLNGSDMYTLEHSPMAHQQPDPKRFEKGKFYCETCKRLFVGGYQWQLHYRSKTHRKALYKKKVYELQKKFIDLKSPKKREVTVADDDDEMEQRDTAE